MPEIIPYLLKVNIALLLFYGGYHFVLQRYTFHTLNRFYLSSGLLYSAVYPLIDISGLLSRNEELKQKIGGLTPDWQGSIIYVAEQAGETGIYWQLTGIVFWTGVIFLSLRFITRLISLFRLHLQSHTFILGEFKFRKIPKAVNPFSFWQTIYLNPECHEAAELRPILEHEQVHVKQLHTLDILLAELGTIFYWFNPGVWLMKKAIRINLEFITDREVIRSGINSKEYQYALLKSNILPQNPLPVNNFHFLTIKKRIAMINKKPSGRMNLGGYLLIFPAIMLFVMIVGTSKASFRSENIRKVMEVLPQIQFPDIEGSSKAEKNIQERNGRNRSLQASAVIMPDTNKIKIRIRSAGDGITGPSEIVRAFSDTISGGLKPVYIIDGVQIAGEPGRIDPDSIKNITVIKGASAIAAYGPEARNGAISIVTKSTGEGISPSAAINGSGINIANKDQKISLDNAKDVVYVLNGKEAGQAELSLLTVSSISTIEVLKGAEAVIKYGERARKGVILITTK